MAEADLLFHGGTVYTMDPRRPRASALAVAGGRVVAVGEEAEVEGCAGPGTRRVPLEGACVLPAFHDAHLHLLGLASRLTAVDCSSARSIAELQARLVERARRLPPGRWLRAWGYSEDTLAERRHPTRHDLDAAAPHHPVRLAHRSGHADVLNSQALRWVGITRHTPDPPGGAVLRDEHGEPTGVLLEMGDYLDRRIPPLDPEDLAHGVALADRLLLSHGIGTVHDATPANDPERWDLLAGFQERGLLHPFVVFLPGYRHLSAFLQRGMKQGFRQGRMALGPAKVLLTLSTGVFWPPPPEVESAVLTAGEKGFGLALHAVEVEAVLVAGLALHLAGPGSPRGRVEHASECPLEAVALLRQARAWVVTNPQFLHERGDAYLERVPADLQPHLYPIGDLVRAEVPVAFGSDAPVTLPHPLQGVACAVLRCTAGGRVVGPHQAVPLETALACHTREPARLAGMAGERGVLAPGARADFVVLEGDPFAVPPEALPRLRVLRTVLEGRTVWSA